MTGPDLVFHPKAKNDITDIVEFYVTKDRALPALFRARLAEQLDGVRLFPEAGAPLFSNHRRVLLKRFPHMVIYVTGNDRTEIVAVVSVHRDPASLAETIHDRTNK